MLSTNYGSLQGNYNNNINQQYQMQNGLKSADNFDAEISSIISDINASKTATATTAADTTTFQSQGAVAQSTSQTVDKSNDGKFSLLEFGKNLIKGVGQGAVNMVKGIVEHPIKSALVIGGAIALTAVTGGAALPFIAAAGLFTAGISAIPNVANTVGCVAAKDWDG
ncbi:MAG: hypothetical protein PHV68_10350, partial [Candidatus Gastranaerophilales bacterium]|nr:hypothetical protein [Candidatus Gastranaerophilales bacterium]